MKLSKTRIARKGKKYVRSETISLWFCGESPAAFIVQSCVLVSRFGQTSEKTIFVVQHAPRHDRCNDFKRPSVYLWLLSCSSSKLIVGTHCVFVLQSSHCRYSSFDHASQRRVRTHLILISPPYPLNLNTDGDMTAHAGGEI